MSSDSALAISASTVSRSACSSGSNRCAARYSGLVLPSTELQVPSSAFRAPSLIPRRRLGRRRGARLTRLLEMFLERRQLVRREGLHLRVAARVRFLLELIHVLHVIADHH